LYVKIGADVESGVCRFDVIVEPEAVSPNIQELRRGAIVMRYLSIYKTVERSGPPSQEEIAKMGKLIEQGMKAGWLIATEGCLPTALGAKVRSSEGKVTVVDGPFTEAKEVVGGFAILRANSKDEVISLRRTS
jgi:hypothetical protein